MGEILYIFIQLRNIFPHIFSYYQHTKVVAYKAEIIFLFFSYIKLTKHRSIDCYNELLLTQSTQFKSTQLVVREANNCFKMYATFFYLNCFPNQFPNTARHTQWQVFIFTITADMVKPPLFIKWMWSMDIFTAVATISARAAKSQVSSKERELEHFLKHDYDKKK